MVCLDTRVCEVTVDVTHHVETIVMSHAKRKWRETLFIARPLNHCIIQNVIRVSWKGFTSHVGWGCGHMYSLICILILIVKI